MNEWYEMPETSKEEWDKFLDEKVFNAKEFVDARKHRDNLSPEIKKKYDDIVKQVVTKLSEGEA